MNTDDRSTDDSGEGDTDTVIDDTAMDPSRSVSLENHNEYNHVFFFKLFILK